MKIATSIVLMQVFFCLHTCGLFSLFFSCTCIFSFVFFSAQVNFDFSSVPTLLIFNQSEHWKAQSPGSIFTINTAFWDEKTHSSFSLQPDRSSENTLSLPFWGTHLKVFYQNKVLSWISEVCLSSNFVERKGFINFKSLFC